MNLLRSICCLFGRQCDGEEPQPTKESVRGKPPVSESDFGQEEAELEKTLVAIFGNFDVREGTAPCLETVEVR